MSYLSFVDTHAHLGDAQFDADRPEVVVRAFSAGVRRFVEIADHPDEWERALAVARAHPAAARCALGLHPYYADRYDAGFTKKLAAALDAAPEAVAVGEIGLDFYTKCTIPRDVQTKAFEALLDFCKDRGAVMVLHCRDAYNELIPLLRERWPAPPADGGYWGVVHCFTGSPEQAEACAALGFALGADGPVTYKKNDALREAFRRVGPGATVLETDSPYLPPQSSRGKRNEPAAIPEIAAKLAEVWGLSLDETAARTSANAAKLFRWP